MEKTHSELKPRDRERLKVGALLSCARKSIAIQEADLAPYRSARVDRPKNQDEEVSKRLLAGGGERGGNPMHKCKGLYLVLFPPAPCSLRRASLVQV